MASRRADDAAPLDPEHAGTLRGAHASGRSGEGTGTFRTDSGGPLPAELLEDPNPGILRGALHVLYDLTWVVAGLGGLPWLAWRSLRSRAFRRLVAERLGAGLDGATRGGRARVLVHGVSVGEVKAAVPIVRGIEAAHPELEVVVSTMTDTGMEVGRRLLPDNVVVRFPADISSIAARFLRKIDPSLVLLVELEIWPNFLRTCNRWGVPVAVVNGRITDLSHGNYLFFRHVLPQFNRISMYCVQLEEYARRFAQLGVASDRIRITGNVKVDGLPIGRVDPGEELETLLHPDPSRLVVVAGSTHEPEELLISRAWRDHAPETRLVLVPRHPRRTPQLLQELGDEGLRLQTLSGLRRGEPPRAESVVIVDTIGELERIYGLADVVFVGGSLIPHGGQNMLEPAAQGKAILLGPSTFNFAQEVALLKQRDALRQIDGPEELGPALAEILTDDGLRERMGARGMEAVAAQRGATRKTLEVLERLSLARVSGARAARVSGGRAAPGASEPGGAS